MHITSGIYNKESMKEYDFKFTPELCFLIIMMLCIPFIIIAFDARFDKPVDYSMAFALGGSDRIAAIGANHLINEWESKTGERALYNPYIFGGMPWYQHADDRVSRGWDLTCWSMNIIILILVGLINSKSVKHFFKGALYGTSVGLGLWVIAYLVSISNIDFTEWIKSNEYKLYAGIGFSLLIAIIWGSHD